MSFTRTVFVPLMTFPEAIPDGPIRTAVGFAAGLGPRLRVTAFSVDLPPVYSPLGGMVLDVSSLVRAAEERSAVECARIEAAVKGAAAAGQVVEFTRREVQGAAMEAAAVEARYADLTVLPWTDTAGPRDIAEAVVFGAGRPVVIVPEGAWGAPDHLAIAWDGSRVAARALADALPLLPEGARVTVLTVRDEKPVGPGIGERLAASLAQGGLDAVARDVQAGGRSIAVALQEAAAEAGAGLLAMGGFGHSRFRDLILGGATKGVLTDLRMPVLLSH